VELDITAPKLDIVKRCVEILKLEGIKAPMEEIRKIPALVDAFYPDIRSVIKTLQNCVDENNILKVKEFKLDEVFVSNLIDDILESKDAIAARRYVIENELQFNSDYSNLLMQLYKYVIDKTELDHTLKAAWTIVIAEYLYRLTSAIDAEICMAACLAEMCMKITK
jgi:regulator of replication initiation timing